ncbi:MAG: hypothetical protein JW959_07120 [Pirellulales bacterium]|nr:hypothetical protein [Pirellulales bacterium]
MTDKFDPYHKWLGIPAGDRPPNHYRLLGIEPLESDPEVICNAADARMALVKTFQAGRHSDDSQRLLNELAAAKVCLLNAEKKAEYDRRLEERAKSGGESEEGPPVVVVESRPSAYLARKQKRQSAIWLVPPLAVGVLVVLAIILSVVLRDSDEGRARRPIESAQSERRPPSAPAPAPLPSTPRPAPSEPSPAEPEPEPREAPAAPPAELPEAAEEPRPAEPKKPVPPVAELRKPAPRRTRLSVPEAAAQRRAETEIRALFAEDFAAADTAKKKMALAAMLLKQSGKAKDDPAARFVCHRLAAETAARTGELSKGFKPLERLAILYEADPLSLKLDMAEALLPDFRPGASGNVSTADLWINVAAMTALAGEAERSDDYASAARAAKLAIALARLIKDDELLRDATTLQREIGYRKSRFRAVETALQALAEDPDDGESNLTAGQWRCFALGDWERGLPLLAKGSNAELAELARRDMARPASAEEQKALGDAWLAAAAKGPSPVKGGLLSRARYWYEAALPKLTGAEKIDVDERIDGLHEKNIFGTNDRGAVVKGNVALARRGATVSGAEKSEHLLDGKSSAKQDDPSTVSPWPCRWIVTLDRPYALREIRFRLRDHDSRYYRYKLSVSSNGARYDTVKDASRGEWTSWQQIAFPARPVKTILVEGLYNSANHLFHIVELEAYCIPPEAAAK